MGPVMRIAQIAPLIESVPPKLYGGTERVVSYLTEELVRQGHDVTLFASGDSLTQATLVPCAPMALRLDPRVKDPIPHQILMLELVRQRAEEFDVLHFHGDLFHFPVFRGSANRTITTLHGRLDLPDLQPYYGEFRDIPLVSISNDQRRPLPPVNWLGTVYHGLPRNLLPFQPFARGDYLAFLGRISPEKRPDQAIKIAACTGIPLKIAAKIDRVDQDYWNEIIKPMIALHSGVVEFIGEINEREKGDFLGDAMALILPIDWPEPFGLVMIEAMACGTPIVAFRAGSVPEIVQEGVSGFIVNNIEEAAKAVVRTEFLDRTLVRADFESRFTVERMARDYLSLYGHAAESLVNAELIPQLNGNLPCQEVA